jgi:hypothetical protein
MSLARYAIFECESMMNFLNNWIFKPEYLPAWLQAASAVTALAISVGAVCWAGAAARRRDRLERGGIAVAIYPELQMLKVSTALVREGIAEMKERYGNLHGQSIAASFQNTTSIAIPPMIERNVDKLFLLGDLAGPSCLHLFRFLLQYNATVEQFASRAAIMNAAQWIEAADQLDEHLTLLDGIIDKCEQEVRPIHASIAG